MYEIRSDLPIPAGRSKYPFSEMNVGDAFFIPTDTPAKKAQSVRQVAVKRDGKFIVRSTVVEGVTGVGVWRTE